MLNPARTYPSSALTTKAHNGVVSGADPGGEMRVRKGDMHALVDNLETLTVGGKEASFVEVADFSTRGRAAREVVSRVLDSSGVARAPVFISGDGPAMDAALLRDLGVSHVVNATTHVPNNFPEQCTYLRVPVLDVVMPVHNTDFQSVFPEVVDFIAAAREDGTGVLVHCMWGVSRSVAIVLAYMISSKWVGPPAYTLQSALAHISKMRPAAQPNTSFMRQLLAYEQQVHGEPGSVDLACYKDACLLRETRPSSLADLVSGLQHTQKVGQRVVCAGHVMYVERIRTEPRMARVTGFLTSEECDYIVAFAKKCNALHRSYTAGLQGEPGMAAAGADASSKVSIASAGRTSHSCRIDRSEPMAYAALARAARLVGLTPQHSEPLQVVHYDVSQQYREHYDFFDADTPGYQERLGTQGQRLVTVFVYLNDCPEGGNTYFPRLDLRSPPSKGSAMLWYNIDRNGSPDKCTLHAGEPVKAGEKWGMNIWLREKEKSDTAKE